MRPRSAAVAALLLAAAAPARAQAPQPPAPDAPAPAPAGAPPAVPDGAPAPAAAGPEAPPPPATSAPRPVARTLAGTVQSLDAGAARFTVGTPEGPLTFAWDRNTAVYLAGGLGSPLDVRVGQPVRVSFGPPPRHLAFWVELQRTSAAGSDAPAPPPSSPARAPDVTPAPAPPSGQAPAQPATP